MNDHFPQHRYPSEPYLVHLNDSYCEYQLPISVKAVIRWQGRVPLLKNERDEWELPGGKLEVGEDLAECLSREISEELSWNVTFGNPSDSWVYKIRPDRHVLVVTFYGDYLGSRTPAYSHEHKSLTIVSPADAMRLNMPAQYKASIARAFRDHSGA